MDHIKALKEKATAALGIQKTLNAKLDVAGYVFTDAEKAEFAKAQTDFDTAMAAIDRAEAVAKAEARVAAVNVTPPKAKAVAGSAVDKVTEPAATDDGSMDVEGDEMRDVSKLSAVQLLGIGAWAAAKHKMSPSKSAADHLEAAGLNVLADRHRKILKDAIATKSFQTLAGGGGDNTIFTPLSSDWIPTLRNMSAYMSGNPVTIDLSNGSLKLAGGLAGATGTYGTEGANIGYSQMTSRAFTMQAKHLTSITAVSNYNIAVSPFAVAQIVGEDLSIGIGLATDAAGLRANGSGANPTGLRFQTNAANIFADASASVAPTYAQVDTAAQKALTLIRVSNIPKVRRTWMMSNRVFTYIQFMRNAYGDYLFPGMQQANPTWYDGYPVIVSEQIPSNLGAGTNESEIYLCDFAYTLMGIARQVQLVASNEASYINGASTMVSTFAADETAIRAVCSHDFALKYDKACVIITTVKWGA